MKILKFINLSYDIPKTIKGSDEPNDLTRKALIKELAREKGIELSYQFAISQNGKVTGHQEIIYPVATTLVFASEKTLGEIADILSKFNKKLYYVLTEVKENIDDYMGRMVDDEELQQNFTEDLEAIKTELREGK